MKHIISAVILILMASSYAWAEDNPEKLLREINDVVLDDTSEEVKNKWKEWVRAQNWVGSSSYNGGVQQFKDRDLIVASGIAFTSVRIGQPGWHESRVAAYERAELEAKTQIMNFLLNNVEQERFSELVENAQTNDGEIQKAKETSAIGRKLKLLGEKGMMLADAKLDTWIAHYKENYDPEEFRLLPPEQQRIEVEAIFKSSIKSSVMRTFSGITPTFTSEGMQGEQYAVLVGVVWTPKLNRLAVSLANDTYNIPPLKPGKNISAWLDTMTGTKVLGTWGTRIVIDDNGDYTIVAFAQAEPRKVSPTRQQSAIQIAKDISTNRARAMIANFVKEAVSQSGSVDFSEVFQGFEDSSQGAEGLREFRNLMRSSTKNVRLRGLQSMKEWSADHPLTGQKVAGSVVVWSPSSRAMAEDAEASMTARPSLDVEEKIVEPKTENTKPKGVVIESISVDTSAY